MSLGLAMVSYQKYMQYKNTDKLDFIKMKRFCASNDIIKRGKENPQNQRKYALDEINNRLDVKKKIYIAVETTQNEAQAIKRLKT